MTDPTFINIRKAEATDAEQIHSMMRDSQTEMENASMYVIGSPRRIQEFLASPGGYGYVATDADGKVVSFALFAVCQHGPSLTTDIPRQLIESKGFPYDMSTALRCVNFATRPEYRSLGIANHLISTGISHGRRNGCKSILALIDPRNDGAISMMSKHGLRIHATAGGFASVGRGYVSYCADEVTGEEGIGRYALTRNILCGAVRR